MNEADASVLSLAAYKRADAQLEAPEAMPSRKRRKLIMRKPANLSIFRIEAINNWRKKVCKE